MSGLLIKSLWKKEHNHFCLSTLQQVESSWAVSTTVQKFILNFEAIRKFRNRHEIPEYLNPLSHSSYQSYMAIMCLLEQLHSAFFSLCSLCSLFSLGPKSPFFLLQRHQSLAVWPTLLHCDFNLGTSAETLFPN